MSEHHRDDSASDREEMGNRASSSKHPPHVSESAEGEPVQEGLPKGQTPVLPANASGVDKVDADEMAQPIDRESMYDRRPEEDKDHDPTRDVRGS